MTPDEALAYLQSFPDWERGTVANEETYTLDRMRRLLEVLDHPERAYDIVHVVGTKGKGSTAAMIDSCLRAAGYRTGLFISPHLVDYRERVRVDGTRISREDLAAIVAERLRPAVERLRAAGDRPPLHFELLCALAFDYFRRRGVEVVVVEAGLGGRLDATNAVATTALTAITTIGYDHMAVLGETLTEIAGEKAAVVRPGVPVVCAPQPPEAMVVIEQVCRSRGAPLWTVGREWRVEVVEESINGTTFDVSGPGLGALQDTPGARTAEDRLEAGGPRGTSGDGQDARAPRIRGQMEAGAPRDAADGDGLEGEAPGQRRHAEPAATNGVMRLRVPLAGAHQAANAATAVAALAALAPRYPRLSGEAIAQGLAAVRWPGRMQVAARAPLVLLDAAHNRESAAALAGAVARLYPGQPFVLVVAVFRDKDAAAVLAPLLPLAARVVVAAADHPRAMPASDLADGVRALGGTAQQAPTVAAALARARDLAGPGGRVLVTGSLRTVGEALAALGLDGVNA